MEENKKSFSQIFDRMRKLKGGMSISAFARAVGTNQQTMNNYMGGRCPPLEIAVRIASTFGVSTDWLLGLSDDPHGFGTPRDDAATAELKKKIHDLEVENATLKNALSIVGGRRVPTAKIGGAPATKTA